MQVTAMKMTDEEAVQALSKNLLRDAVCMARVDFMDQICKCRVPLRSNCPVCIKLEFLGDGVTAKGFYYLPFTTDEEAVQWSMTGHIRHQLVDISDGRLLPLMDKLARLQRRKTALETQVSNQFQSILDALPEWESAHE